MTEGCEIVMPQLGESIARGSIAKWLVAVGDRVERDQPLFEVSTDKVDAEIPSPASGVLTRIYYPVGTTVPVNTIVAWIGPGAPEIAPPPAVELNTHEAMSISSRTKATRWLAYSLGLLAPLGDTVRRWSTWREFPPALLDDYLMGALLIAGAWATRDHRYRSPRGRALLAAAWGFTCALGYCSVFLHWLGMQAGELDPAPIPTQWVFAIKVLGTLLAIIGLVLTLVDTPTASPETTPST